MKIKNLFKVILLTVISCAGLLGLCSIFQIMPNIFYILAGAFIVGGRIYVYYLDKENDELIKQIFEEAEDRKENSK